MAVNDRVARATADDYLKSVLSAGATPEELATPAARHLLEHATAVKLVGTRSNRLVVEFDLDDEIRLEPKPRWAPVPPQPPEPKATSAQA